MIGKATILLCLLVALSVAQCPANCQSCSGGKNCNKCQVGYILLQDLTCKEGNGLIGCRMYTASGRCAECQTGFNLFGGFCYPPIPYCQQYGPGNICVKCQDNYTVFRDRCLMSNNSICQEMGQGLYQGMCIQIPITNCLQLSDRICSKCATGFQIIQGLCFRLGQVRQPSCRSPNIDGTCNQCVPAYYLRQGRCINTTVEDCVRNEGIVCLQCTKGFNLNNGACLRPPKSDDPNCNVVDIQNDQCIGCNFQYRLNSQKFCVKINTYCASFDLEGRCATCQSPLRLINGNCLYGDQNCLTPDYDSLTCQRCRPGYSLSTDLLSCQLTDPCVQKSQKSCLACVDTYQLVDGGCFFLPSNCVQLDPINKWCNNCGNSTSLLDGRCVFSTNFCSFYDLQTGICAQCVFGFYLRDRRCVGHTPSCLRVNQEFQCIQCIPGNIIVNGLCVRLVDNCVSYVQTGCQYCQDGYYLYLNKCQRNPIGCIYTDQQTRCLLCQQNYVLFQGKCVNFQLFCLDYDRQGNCVAVPRDFEMTRLRITNRFAAQWDNNGNFINCMSGYTLIQRNCVLKIDNCLAYDQMGACQACDLGFHLNETICISAPNICLTQEGKKCTLCVPQFVVVNGSCHGRKNFGTKFDNLGFPITLMVGYNMSEFGVALPLNYNCIRQNFTSGQCLQCARFYVLQNSSCILKDSNCLNYNPRGICQVCRNGFRFLFGVCRSVQFCKSSLPNGTCTECYSGFVQNSGVCVRSKVDKCGQYDASSICKACIPGFYVTPINSCAVQPRNCLTAAGQGRCSRCQPNYELIRGVCVRSIKNCLEYAEKGCLRCQIGYAIANDGCVMLPPFCRTIDPETLRCQRCINGFVPVNNKQFCAMNISNCLFFNVDGTCKQCIGSFFLANNRCFNLSNKCNRYGPDGNCIECMQPFVLSVKDCRLNIRFCTAYTSDNCSACQNGYYLTADKMNCEKNPNNCLNFSISDGCRMCASGFTARNGSCISNSGINMDGCATQASPIECRVCLPGFTLTRDGICQATVCLRYDSRSRCLECPVRFDFTNGQCIARNCAFFEPSTALCANCSSGYQIARSPFGVYCRARNCSRFDFSEICQVCNRGFFLNTNNLCSIANCLTQVNFICFTCLQGFQLRNGFCEINNCAKTDDRGKCENCSLNYIVKNGLCVQDPRCSLVLPNGRCQACNPGFVLNQMGSCELANCLNLSADGKCTKCINGYELSENGQCLSTSCLQFDTSNACTRCAFGYRIANRTCVIDGCEVVDMAKGGCSRCQPRYDPYNGFCRPSNCTSLTDGTLTCRICHNRYDLSNGICVAKSCVTFNENRDCAVCLPGYQQVAGFCTFINCRRFDDFSCLECSPGFSFDGDRTCTSRSCLSYSVTTGRCSSCNAGFRLINELCVPTNCNGTNLNGTCINCLTGFVIDSSGFCWNQDPCQTYNREGRCVSCQQGYGLNDVGACFVRNCLYFDALSLCVQCLSGFSLQNFICISEKCSKKDANGYCVQCSQGYTLINEGSCLATNCQTYYNSVCIRCFRGFGLQATGLCRFDACSEYDATNKCTSCSPGYAMRNNICVSQNCLVFDGIGNKCVQCRGGFLLEKGQCMRLSDAIITIGCQTYNSATSVCSVCQPGFSLNGQICQARYCIRADANQCMECMQGYQLGDSNRRCLTPNCQSYDPDSFDCTACAQDYLLSVGRCIYQTPVVCPSGQYIANRTCVDIPIRFCIRYDQNSRQCLECNFLTTLIKGRCFNIRNCENYNDNGCQVCNPGYYLSNGFCILSKVQDCNVSDSAGRCLSCMAGFILQNQNCFDVRVNCVQFEPLGCITCASGFIPLSGLCVQLPPNCATIHPNKTCMSCLNGFEMTRNRTCRRIIDFCQNYNETGCRECQRGYQLAPNGNCVRLVEGCIKTDSSGRCTQCRFDYTMLAMGTGQPAVCVRRLDNCERYSALGCEQCRVGFKIVSRACAPIVAYCIQYDPDSVCTGCELGYYLSQGLCVPLPNGCLSVDFSYLCTACRQQFVLLRGACFNKRQNCQEYDMSNGNCVRCSSNSSPDSKGNCLPMPKNCVKLDGQVCGQCQDNFDLFQGKCYGKVNGCNKYSQNGCVSCQQGLELSNQQCRPDKTRCVSFNEKAGLCLACNGNLVLSNGICYEPIAGCRQYNGIGGCLKCDIGFTQSNNGSCMSANCLVVDQGTCIRCNSGYMLQDGNCVVLCTQRNMMGRCIECVSSYTLVDGVCLRAVENCNNYGQDGRCQFCNNGYYLTINRTCMMLPAFCTAADVNGVCVGCQQGFNMINGFCAATRVENCISISVTGTCLACQLDYELRDGGRACVRRQAGTANLDDGLFIGVACRSGQTLIDGNCVKPIPNCRRYTQQSCVMCNPGFNLQNNQCSTSSFCTSFDMFGNCASCADGYTLSGTNCHKTIQFCLSYNAFEKCQNCNPGHYLSQLKDSCKAYPPNCVQVDSSGSCLQCSPSSNNVDGKCVLKINYCLKYGDAGRCIGCADGYFEYEGSCSQLPPNCVAVDQNLNCKTCHDGSVLINGICSRPIPNCFLYDSRGRCQTCRFLYFLSRQGLCVPYPMNCVSVDQLGNCLGCCPGSYTQNGQCVSFTRPDVNCEKYEASSNRCIQCASEYNYCVSCNRCVKMDPNCYSFSVYDYTLCTACNFGYYLISNECVNRPPGVLLGSGSSLACRPTYVPNNGKCFKNISLTTPLTSRPIIQTVFSSIDQALPLNIVPKINGSVSWKPAQVSNNEYIGYKTPTVALIEAIQIQGNGIDEWVESFSLEFTNGSGGKFRCFSNCAVIPGNKEAQTVQTISLDFPIAANQIRLIPRSWQKGISCRVDFLIN